MPQQLGPVTYVGSPYHIKFGDKFTPRCLLIDTDFNTKDLHFPAPKKYMLRIRFVEQLRDYKIRSGDFLKVEVRLTRSDLPERLGIRADVKQVAQELGAQLRGVSLKLSSRPVLRMDRGALQISRKSDMEIFKGYCQQRGIAKEIMTTGLGFLEEQDHTSRENRKRGKDEDQRILRQDGE